MQNQIKKRGEASLNYAINFQDYSFFPTYSANSARRQA